MPTLLNNCSCFAFLWTPCSGAGFNWVRQQCINPDFGWSALHYTRCI